MTCADLAVSVLGEGTDPADFTTDSFIALGGDSLRAMRLAALAEEQLGLRIAAAALLSETPLATVLSGAEPVTGTGTESATADAPDDGSLSPAQRGMWLIESLAGGSPYNLVFTCFVEDGTLDRDCLAKALAETT
ncbi:non-ribosomal peptide synthetase, partial [Streptomyces sp. SID7834]